MQGVGGRRFGRRTEGHGPQFMADSRLFRYDRGPAFFTARGWMNKRTFLTGGLCVAGFALPVVAGTLANAEAAQDLRLRDLSGEPAFKAYYHMGGVVQFSVYYTAADGDDAARAAISQTLTKIGPVNTVEFAALSGRPISEAGLWGDAYDPADGSLIRRGDFRLLDGRRLIDPKLSALKGAIEVSAVSSLEAPGTGGQLAQAFIDPPYGLSASPDKIQAAFDGIKAVILPAGCDSVILDWTTPRLEKVSSFFAAGMEWWGVYLFTVSVPARQQITVIAASATD